MNTALIILSFILILFIVASLHEFGHFITARRAGVKVEEFGLGFPPRIFSFKKGDVVYSINAIPAGAFVKSVGENDPTVPFSLASRNAWQRLVVYAAGPVVNIILAIVFFSLYFSLPTEALHADGIMVHEVVAQSPADMADIESGDIILSIAGNTVHNSGDVQEAVKLFDEIGSNTLPIIINKDTEIIQKSVIPKYNPDYERYTIGVFLCWNGIVDVEEGSIAEQAGLKEEDCLISINQQPVYTKEDVGQVFSDTTDQEDIELVVMRKREIITTSLPATTKFTDANENQSTHADISGATIKWVDNIHIEKETVPFTRAVYLGTSFIIRIPELIIRTIPIMRNNPEQAALVGPIGAGQLTVEIVKSSGFDNILFIAGLISLGIGLFNFIPVPPLDGGGILVALIEGVRGGKRLTQHAMRIAYTTGTVLLIALMIFITFNDIMRLIQGKGFGM